MDTKRKAVGIFIAAIVALSVMTLALPAGAQDKTAPAATSLSTGESGGIYAVMGSGGSTNGGNILWDNGLPDGVNGISCVLSPGFLDREIVDDFDVPEPGWDVTDGHFRIIFYGFDPEIIDGIRVFFYEDIGNQPSTVRYAERNATYNAHLTGNTYFTFPERAVDCTFDTVTLAPGKWWVCFQPEMDDNCFWLTAAGSGESIWGSMPDLSWPKWTNSSSMFGEDYDMSFQLTGPAPAPVPTLTPIGLIALISVLSLIAAVTITRRRKRR